MNRDEAAREKDEIMRELGPRPTTPIEALAQVVRIATNKPDDAVAVNVSYNLYGPGWQGLTYGDLRQLLLTLSDQNAGRSKFRDLAIAEITKERG